MLHPRNGKASLICVSAPPFLIVDYKVFPMKLSDDGWNHGMTNSYGIYELRRSSTSVIIDEISLRMKPNVLIGMKK